MKQNEKGMAVSKKAYAAPKLTEYGSVASLTKGNIGSRQDGGNEGFDKGKGN